MKTNYLFPEIFRKIGYFLFVPFFISGLYCLFGDGTDKLPFHVFALLYDKGGFGHTEFCGWIENGLLDEISIIGLTISLLFIAFSKEKEEDECIVHIRMQSIVWAIIVNYAILILATAFIYDTIYLSFTFINLFTVLFLFILKYNWELYKFRRTNND